ncbi:MAG TPA: SH3 domain-containing protein [Candidatus Acidoferrales bacterium]|nr:SH3 domain-containing protein [Candidatus Acidoferrales bacterium]
MSNQHALRLCMIFLLVLIVSPARTALAQDVVAAARANRAREALAASATQGMVAKTRCTDQPYVSVTADSARGMPLNSVATLKCGEEITVLSDPQGYTLKVRTADGIIGYVIRYEVVFVHQNPQPAAAINTDASPNSAPALNDAKPVTASSSDGTANDSSKPRVYLSDTQSWTASGGFGRSSSIPEGKLYGGYDPELADIYQGFTSDCPAVVVTQEKSKANYAVLFDKGTSKKGLTGLGGLVKVNKVTVLSPSGETVFSQAAHSADVVVKQTCDAIAQRTTSASTTQPHP